MPKKLDNGDGIRHLVQPKKKKKKKKNIDRKKNKKQNIKKKYKTLYQNNRANQTKTNKDT